MSSLCSACGVGCRPFFVILWCVFASVADGQDTSPQPTSEPAANVPSTSDLPMPRRRIVVQLSRELFEPLVDKAIDRTTPLTDVILGTPVRGWARTTGQPKLDLLDDPDSAAFVITVRGANVSRTVGHNGLAVIYSRADTRFGATKRITYQPGKGFIAEPTRISVVTRTITEGIASTRRGLIGRIVRRRASREVAALRPTIDAIARQRAETRISRAMDNFLAQRLAKVNKNADFRQAIALALGGDGEANFACSTKDDCVLLAISSGPDEPMAVLPKFDGETAPIQVWVHDTLVGGNIAAWLKRWDETKPGTNLAQRALEIVPDVLKKPLGLPEQATESEVPVNYVTAGEWIVIQIDPQPEAGEMKAVGAERIVRSEARQSQETKPADTTRTWTSADGRYTVAAKLVSTTVDAVTLQRADDGQMVTVPMSRLSEADRGAARTQLR